MSDHYRITLIEEKEVVHYAEFEKLIDKINYKLVTYNLKKVELIITETLKM